MNLVLDQIKYSEDNVFFYEPVKNTVMDNSKFIRIIYSDEYIVLNGLYLKINLNNYDNNLSLELFNNIEKNLLNKYCREKSKVIKISEQIKFFIKKQNNENIILKISGIWETENSVGLTYKFMNID